MLHEISRQLKPALKVLGMLTLLTGFLYPAILTGMAQVIFPHEANGSLVLAKEKPVGSEWIGQPFTSPKYFWGRPSATSPFPYNAAASAGSNAGPTNPALVQAVKERIAALRSADPNNTLPVPVDLVTASASGLDPHISPAAAEYQLSRVARARGMSEAKLREVISQHTEGPTLKFLGEPRVNVLRLNLALDGLASR